MKIMGHNIPFHSCVWLKTQEPQSVALYILAAANAAERRQRLQWLWEGSLMYHMEGKATSPAGCPVEKAMFTRLVSHLANVSHQRHLPAETTLENQNQHCSG